MVLKRAPWQSKRVWFCWVGWLGVMCAMATFGPDRISSVVNVIALIVAQGSARSKPRTMSSLA